LKIPVAHGEGRYYADNKVLDDLEANNHVIYRYCDEAGNITPESNPNAASRNIAGIRSAEGNVFGMMPHPERATSEALGNTDGRIILNALLINESLIPVKQNPALVNI
jgi:phosphoribosylformylglycinamidine synthase